MTDENRNKLIIAVCAAFTAIVVGLTMISIVYLLAWHDVEIAKIKASAPQEEVTK